MTTGASDPCWVDGTYLEDPLRTLRPALVVAAPIGCLADWALRTGFGVTLRLIEPAVLRIGCTARRTGLVSSPRRKLTAYLSWSAHRRALDVYHVLAIWSWVDDASDAPTARACGAAFGSCRWSSGTPSDGRLAWRTRSAPFQPLGRSRDLEQPGRAVSAVTTDVPSQDPIPPWNTWPRRGSLVLPSEGLPRGRSPGPLKPLRPVNR